MNLKKLKCLSRFNLHLKVHLMHMMNLNHMAHLVYQIHLVHLNLERKDEWFIFVMGIFSFSDVGADWNQK